MKKKEKKLQLSKTTVQNLNNILDREELKDLLGGTDILPMGTTLVPVYCKH